MGRFNTPEFAEDSTEVINKPISSAQQAFEVFQRLQRDNQARANRNKLIADQYNGANPFDQKKLDANAQGWRANFSTLVLATFVDRVTPRLTDAVHAMKHLTASALPDSFLDATNKTQKFRERTSEQIRSWNGWVDFVEQVATENVLYGYTGSVQMDQFEWRPQTFRQEDLLFDEQCPQLADKVPVFVVKANYYIHEACEIIYDSKTAQKAGYHVENIKSAIERAAPPYDSFVYNPRQLSDMVREGNLYYSFHRSSKMLETCHVFVKCYDNSVDHWWCNRNASKRSNSGKAQDKERTRTADIIPLGKNDPKPMDDDPYELGYFDRVAESMADVITLFSFQAGNNRLFGSKGIGRLLYNISLAVEKARMSFIDAMYISGLLIGQAEEAIIGRLQPHVRSPFMIIPEGFQLLMQQFRVEVNNWLGLDQKLTNTAEIIAGAFLPDQQQISNNGQTIQTATKESIDAVKEEEVKQGMMNRWWVQFTKGVSSIERRIYSKTNLRAAMKQRKARLKAADDGKTLIDGDLYDAMMEVDPDTDKMFVRAPSLDQADQDSVETIIALLDDGLSIQEIILLAHSPATDSTTDAGSPQDDMQFIQFYQLAKGNQNFDQNKLDEMAANRMIGFKVTKEIYVPNPQQTTVIEAQRAQQQEWGTMLGTGIGIQVSQRDPHMQHFQTLVPAVADHLKIASQMPPVQVPKDLLNACKLGATHCEAHLQAMLQQGANERQLRPQILQLKDLEKMLNELVQRVTQAEMMAAQMQMMAQQNMGLAGMGAPGLSGMGGAPGGGGGMPAGPLPGRAGPMGIPMGHVPNPGALAGGGNGSGGMPPGLGGAGQ